MLATIPSATVIGVEGQSVCVEVHVSTGVGVFTIVGLPDAACREARDRVRAAISACEFKVKSEVLRINEKRVTINLAPSNVRKTGSGMDLAIAVGFLVACNIIDAESVVNTAFVGELGLDGSIRSVPGMVPLVDAIPEETVVVPKGCARQAELVGRHKVRIASNLRQLVAQLAGDEPWEDELHGTKMFSSKAEPDLSDVRGQPLARWALEVAAAGGHNLMLNGTPGSGKTMLARRLVGLLPDLDSETALLVTKIHSAAGLLSDGAGLITRPPFRSPHHTSSVVSLVGGGSGSLRPGEVSLAHGGVLFMDEMTETPRSILDAIREPLEEGFIHLARANAKVIFPARFQCIGAMNPCPCGEGLNLDRCRCSVSVRLRYASKLSGPLKDRFDLRVNVTRPAVDDFFALRVGESTAVVADRVMAARERMAARGVINANLSSRELESIAPLSGDAERLVMSEMRNERLTARGLHRVHRVALTLADLDGSAVLSEQHVAAALQLRTVETQVNQ